MDMKNFLKNWVDEILFERFSWASLISRLGRLIGFWESVCHFVASL